MVSQSPHDPTNFAPDAVPSRLRPLIRATIDPLRYLPAGWYDPSDSTTLFDATSGGALPADGAGVARYADKSGNAQHLTQSTAGARPLRIVAGLNGRDCLRFDGVDDWISKAPFGDLSAAGTIIAVFKDTETSGRNFNTVAGFSTGGPTLCTDSSTYAYGLGKPGTYNPQGAQRIDETEQVVMAASWNGTAARTYLNGYKVTATLSEGFSSASTRLQLGQHNGGFSWWGGDMGEVLVFSRQLTDEEVVALTGYLKAKWGVPGLLPLNFVVSRVAPFGDSIEAQGSSGLYNLGAGGFWVFSRAMCGSMWDSVANGSELTFATGGARLDELATTHMANLIASNAEAVLVGGGTNDAVQGIAVGRIVDLKRYIADKLRKAGKNPVVLSVPPIQTGYSGNGAGAFSATVAAVNTGLQAMCAARGYLYGDITSAIETVVGSGIADAANLTSSSNLHPIDVGAAKMGRTLTANMLGVFTFTGKPLSNTAYLLANADYSAGSGPPTGWSKSDPLNGSTGAQSITVDSGGRWWRLPMIKSTSTAGWTLIHNGPNNSSPAGKTVDCIVRLRVISGSVAVGLTLGAAPLSNVSYDLSNNTGGVFTPSDGIVVLRVPAIALAGNTTLAYPGLSLLPTADCTVEVQLLTPRAVS